MYAKLCTFFLIQGIIKDLLPHDSSGKPVPNYNCNITLSHSGSYSLLCVSSRNINCGIDIQLIDKKLKLGWFNQELITEENCLKRHHEKFFIMTSFKESLGKFLGLGLLADKSIFAIASIKVFDYSKEQFYQVSFANFPTLMGVGFLKNDYVVSIVITKNDFPSFINYLKELKNEL